MKTKRISCFILALFFCFFICASRLFAGDQVEEEYIVRVNGIKMERSSAENLFRYIEETDNGVVDARKVSDEDVFVQTVTENLNVFVGNSFMNVVSSAYENCLSGKGCRITLDNETTRCVFCKINKKINMCIDKDSKVITKLLILN